MGKLKIEGMPDYLNKALDSKKLLSIYVRAVQELNLGSDLVLVVDMEDPEEVIIDARETFLARTADNDPEHYPEHAKILRCTAAEAGSVTPLGYWLVVQETQNKGGKIHFTACGVRPNTQPFASA